MNKNALTYGDKELDIDTTLAIEKALTAQIRKDLEQMQVAHKNSDTDSFNYWAVRYVEYSNALAEITSPDLFKAYLNNIQTEVGTL